MSPMRTYILPAALALGVHAVVMALLLTNWEDQAVKPLTEVKQYYIDAALVTANPHKVKEQKLAAAATERRQAKARLAKQREQERRKQAEKDAKAKAKAESAAKAQAAAEASRLAQLRAAAQQAEAKKAEAQKATSSKQAQAETQKNLALAIRQEQDYRQAVTDDEKAMAYVAQIQREIIQNWSRPPSARNGMQALLKVFLVPTGEVVNVTLQASSGNEAFDRSAMLAVRKAERFIVPAESVQFERNFREFEVLFRPEDLRL